MEDVQCNLLTENMTIIALDRLKFRNHNSFFKYLLLLSGDINLNPGPINNPCLICTKSVSKRGLCCANCGIWMHKKCNKINPEINIVQQDSPALCNFCIDKAKDPCSLWNLLPFPEESLNEIDNEVLDSEIDINNLSHTENWNVFKKRGLHLLHLNINSLLPKIDELRYIAKNSNATVIGISESKLDNSVLDEEVNIEGYKLLRSDRNRHGGGVACYIRNDITYTERENFSTDLENIFFDILLPKSKPILVGIIYRPPDQQMFLTMLTSAIFNTNKFDSQEVYILGDQHKFNN